MITQDFLNTADRVRVVARLQPGFEQILNSDAILFLAELHERFDYRRKQLLAARRAEQERLDAGELPDFPKDTSYIRLNDWKVAPIPQDLTDRRVEITGPTDRKMIINALNSGANAFMADCEDSLSPTWENVIQGQINLFDAVRRTISYYDPLKQKTYQLNEKTAVLIVRPRGWHLEERHLLFDGQAMSGSLVDFGLYFFHNALELIARGTGPYFYLPKLEHYEEARLWNDVFVFAQDYFGIPQGTIKATVLIETILASFQLDEILYTLRQHSAGLNCGRWDYIFSYIKKLKNQPDFILPDRAEITMNSPFMRAYAQNVIQSCHRRGCHAMGGMAAQIPIRGNEEANQAALEKVKADKLREVKMGHDGTWVAHPGLVPIAKAVFDAHMPQPNQIHVSRPAVPISREMLLAKPTGKITEAGLRQNINVGILYIENWLRGNGCVAIYNLMEDAATAEISRTQVWQWLRAGAKLEDGRTIDKDLYTRMRAEELEKIRSYVGEEAYTRGKFDQAVALFDTLVLSEEFQEFLTLPAYDLI